MNLPILVAHACSLSLPHGQEGEFATMRSSVRSRLAPPNFESLAEAGIVGLKIYMAKELDASTFQRQLETLAEVLAQKLRREAPKLMGATPGYGSVDLHVMLRQ
jgi:hypothetical protein